MGFPWPGRVHRWGWIGVDLFFVLSGYLIGGQLLAELARNNRLDLRRFYARRALRILPAYLFILTIYFLLPLWRGDPDMAPPPWEFFFSLQKIALHGGTPFGGRSVFFFAFLFFFWRFLGGPLCPPFFVF